MTDGLPEAPASASVRCQIEGFEWLITIREFTTEAPGLALLNKLKAVNEKIVQMGGAPIYGKGNGGGKADEAPTQTKCELHGVMMDKRTGKDGSTWYSHSIGKDDAGKTIYCKGQPKS